MDGDARKTLVPAVKHGGGGGDGGGVGGDNPKRICKQRENL